MVALWDRTIAFLSVKTLRRDLSYKVSLIELEKRPRFLFANKKN